MDNITKYLKYQDEGNVTTLTIVTDFTLSFSGLLWNWKIVSFNSEYKGISVCECEIYTISRWANEFEKVAICYILSMQLLQL